MKTRICELENILDEIKADQILQKKKNNDFEETVQDEAQRATTKIQQKK